MNVVPISQADSPLDYALRYARLGWHVFPVWGAKDGRCRCGGFCKSPAKHPVSHIVPNGQDGSTTDPERIRWMWAQDPQAGVAVHLAPSGLVAIDIDPRNGGLDSMEQLESLHGGLESDVTAFTQGGGEHRVFKSGNIAGVPGKLAPGVDVKFNGYICVEPTIGTQGSYAWEGSSDPLEGAIPSPLPDWLRGQAMMTKEEIAAKIAENTVTTRAVIQSQIDELRDALKSLPADDRDTWVNFGNALWAMGQDGFLLWDEWSQKSDKYDPVDQMRVWRSFKPGPFQVESIFHAAQQAGWQNPLGGAAPVRLPEPVEVETVKVKPVPVVHEAAIPRIPGALGLVQDWIDRTSRKPQPLFSLQAALAFGATVMGRRYVSSQSNWPSLYFLNIGKSAAGKEHGKWAMEHLLEACDLGNLIGPSNYTSDSGVMSALHRQPSHLTVIDEFGKVLESASIKHNARAQGTMKTIIEVWGRCDGVLRPQGYSTFGMSKADADKMAERTIRNPALTLFALSTDETFFQSIGSAGARDGFLNRFLIVESDIGRQAGRHVARAAVPEEVKEWAKSVHHHEGLVNPDLTPDMAPTAKEIPLSKAALDLFDQFEHECIRLMDDYEDAGLAEMFGRTNEIAMRLSLILAVSCQEAAISAEHAKWAIHYTRSHALRTVERLKDSVADTEFEALKKDVYGKILRAGQRGMTESELEKFSRKFRVVDYRAQSTVLNSLTFIGKIAKVNIQSKNGKGRKREAWVAIEEIPDTDISPDDE